MAVEAKQVYGSLTESFRCHEDAPGENSYTHAINRLVSGPPAQEGLAEIQFGGVKATQSGRRRDVKRRLEEQGTRPGGSSVNL